MEGLRSMPKNRCRFNNHPVSTVQNAVFTVLSFREEIQSPYGSRLKFRDLVQLERITFRAVRVSFRAALFSALNLILSLRTIAYLIIGFKSFSVGKFILQAEESFHGYNQGIFLK